MKKQWCLFWFYGILTCYFSEINSGTLYTVGFNNGNVYSVDTTTGLITTVNVDPLPAAHSGLNSGPLSITITSDRSTAYVSDWFPPGSISKIDLATGIPTPIPLSGTSDPFFPSGISFTDASETKALVAANPQGVILVDFSNNTATQFVQNATTIQNDILDIAVAIPDTTAYMIGTEQSLVSAIPFSSPNMTREVVTIPNEDLVTYIR